MASDGHEPRRWREGVSTQRDAEIIRSSFAQPPSSSACLMSSAVGGRSLFSKSLATSALALLATKEAARARSTALRSCSFWASCAAMPMGSLRLAATMASGACLLLQPAELLRAASVTNLPLRAELFCLLVSYSTLARAATSSSAFNFFAVGLFVTSS
jgi:hypothetical protein